MSQEDQYVFEAIAGDELRNNGYRTRFEEPMISPARLFFYEYQEILRLTRINIYHAMHRLPSVKERR